MYIYIYGIYIYILHIYIYTPQKSSTEVSEQVYFEISTFLYIVRRFVSWKSFCLEIL